MAAFAAGRALPRWPNGGTAELPTATRAAGRYDLVAGPGAWCWFQAPRAAIAADGSLWLGSTQGTGAPQPGSVDVTCVDLARWRVRSRRSLGVDRVDDHTAPSVLAVDGGVQVGWAPHRHTDRLSLGPSDGALTTLSRPGALQAPGRGTAYVSAHLVGGVRWVLYRGEQFSWNLLTSTDGTTWTAAGLVIDPAPAGQRPYLLAASDGRRLHLLATDGNPTEYRGTSVWAGEVGTDLTIRTSRGRAIGRVGSAPAAPSAMTRVVDGTPDAREDHDVDAWLCDLQIVQGRPTAVLSVRSPWPPGSPATDRWQHRYLWARRRRDGAWATEHLGHGGRELYVRQPDYSGLGAVDPTDPRRVIISTDVHPVHARPSVSGADGRTHHELWSGVRTAPGTWRWRFFTQHSIEDNLRPVIASRGGTRIVAWMRGSYRSWTDFDTQLVVRST